MSGNPKVRICTPDGAIKIEIRLDVAPQCGGYILAHVRDGTYGPHNKAAIYRTVHSEKHAQKLSEHKINIIQFGVAPSWETESDWPVFCKAHEATDQTGLTHERGAVSMARSELGTNCTELFICVSDHSELDYGGARQPDGQGFVVVGRVVEGMDLVDRIWAASGDEELLKPFIPIMAEVQDD